MSGQKRQVVILAGGLGTRLRPITEKVPKPMVPVASEPFLYWQLSDLKSQGYKKVLLLVAYLGEQVRTFFGDGSGMGLQIEYAFEPEPLGTGGALKNALPQLANEFILLNGDSFLQAPLIEMERTFERGYDAVISTYDNHDPVPVIPNLKVRGDKVVDYKKDAPASEGFDKIDSGIYVMKKALVEGEKRERFMLADLWPPLIASGKLGAFGVHERFYDIGTPDRLKEFEEKVRDYFPNPVSDQLPGRRH